MRYRIITEHHQYWASHIEWAEEGYVRAFGRFGNNTSPTCVLFPVQKIRYIEELSDVSVRRRRPRRTVTGSWPALPDRRP